MGYSEGFVDSMAAFVIVGVALIFMRDLLGGVVGGLTDSTSQLFVYLIPIGLVIALIFYVINSMSGRHRAESIYD